MFPHIQQGNIAPHMRGHIEGGYFPFIFSNFKADDNTAIDEYVPNLGSKFTQLSGVAQIQGNAAEVISTTSVECVWATRAPKINNAPIFASMVLNFDAAAALGGVLALGSFDTGFFYEIVYYKTGNKIALAALQLGVSTTEVAGGALNITAGTDLFMSIEIDNINRIINVQAQDVYLTYQMPSAIEITHVAMGAYNAGSKVKDFICNAKFSQTVSMQSLNVAANGTLLQAYTMDVGNGWEREFGTMEIQSNKIEVTALSGADNIAQYFTSFSSLSNIPQNLLIGSASIGAVGGYSQIYFGDATRIYALRMDDAAQEISILDYSAGGAPVTLNSASVTLTDSVAYPLYVSVNNSTISCVVDGVGMVNYRLNEPLNIGRVGLESDSLASTFGATQNAYRKQQYSRLLLADSFYANSPTSLGSYTPTYGSGDYNITAGGLSTTEDATAEITSLTSSVAAATYAIAPQRTVYYDVTTSKPTDSGSGGSGILTNGSNWHAQINYAANTIQLREETSPGVFTSRVTRAFTAAANTEYPITITVRDYVVTAVIGGYAMTYTAPAKQRPTGILMRGSEVGQYYYQSVVESP